MNKFLAAKTFGVSYTTLRRRLLKDTFVDRENRGGFRPIFSRDEEQEMVRHVAMFAEYGYGYSVAELRELGSEFAVEKGRIQPGRMLSRNWAVKFVRRNPILRLSKPRPLDVYRAKAANRPNIERFVK